MEKEEIILPIDYTIEPKSHPQHYMMHKYWGRKNYNVISEYISHFTKEGDTVLDPFMGSGVTVIESLKLNRYAIGVDLNPITNMIVKNTIEQVDLELFQTEFNNILERMRVEYNPFYETICDKCGLSCTAQNYVWKDNNLIRVKYKCDECGVCRKNIDSFDLKVLKDANIMFSTVEQHRYYPKDEMLKYVRRNGKTNIDQLFTDRALLILTDLYSEIKKVEDTLVRNLLIMCFTSALPNTSKMIPADEEKVLGKSGWQISKFWVPGVHTEKNVLESFELRFKKILKGKLEVNNLDDTKASIYNTTSESLNFIDSESIDYIFTDPPYGETINYFGLSMLWNSWIEKDVDYSGEIIYDPYRDKDYSDYESRMNNVFKELNRVLKMNHYLSLTFHNRDLKVWKGVLNSCRLNGLQLENIVYQPQAVSSGTQGINKKNTFKGDFIYNFRKVSNNELNLESFEGDFVELVKENSKLIIETHEGATPDQLYSELIPILVNSNSLFNDENNKLNVDDLLEEEFIYIELKGEKSVYKWMTKDLLNQIKDKESIRILK